MPTRQVCLQTVDGPSQPRRLGRLFQPSPVGPSLSFGWGLLSAALCTPEPPRLEGWGAWDNPPERERGDGHWGGKW